MKVLFIEGYPGFRGAQRSLAALADGLSDHIDLEILCTVPGRALEGYRQAGLATRLLEVPASLNSFGGALLRRRALGRLKVVLLGLLPYYYRLWCELRKSRPDILHCNQARAVFLAGPVARLLGIPVVWHLRGLNDLGGFFRQVAHRLACKIICVSEAVRATVPGRGQCKTTVIANGISAAVLQRGQTERPHQELQMIAQQRNFSKATVFLLTASSFIPYKGLHHLVRALTKLLQKRPDLRRGVLWVVLGDDEGKTQRADYQQYLRNLLQQSQIEDHVFWAGWQEEALAWIAASDILVLPTVDKERFCGLDGRVTELVCSEGFPRSILEAMLGETAVIASDVAGVRDQIIDQESGLVLPPGNAEDLAVALENLIDQPGTRTRLVTAARLRVENFSVVKMVRGVMNTYETLLQQKS